MRWKAHFYEINRDDSDNEKNKVPEIYGLKTLNCPPQMKDLIPFENDMFKIVKSLKFRNTRNQFQRQLRRDIKTINNLNTTLTFADKTANMYKLSNEEYNKLLKNAVTSTYKKVNDNIDRKINSDGKLIVKDKVIFNRMLTNEKSEAFITLKDHKPNFQNNPKVRLINPAKDEVEQISKVVLIRHQQRSKEHPKNKPMEKHQRSDRVV